MKSRSLFAFLLVLGLSVSVQDISAQTPVPEDSIIVAQGEMALKHYSSAIAKLNYVLSADSGYDNALAELAGCYMKTDRIPEALKIYKKLLVKYPEWPAGLIGGGWAAFLVKDYDLCSSLMERTIKVDSTIPASYVNLGHVALVKGDMKKAEALYRRVLTKMRSRKELQSHFMDDFDLLTEKKIKTAQVKKMRQMIESEYAKMEKKWRANDAEAQKYSDAGTEAYNAGNYQLAADNFRKAIELTPDNAALYYSLAGAYNGLKDNDNFFRYSYESLAVDPDQPVPYMNMAIGHYYKDEYLLAINMANMYLENDNSQEHDRTMQVLELKASCYDKIARKANDEKRYDDALRIYNFMLANRIRLNPSEKWMGNIHLVEDDNKGNAEIKRNIAYLHIMKQEYAPAKEALRESQELNPEEGYTYYLQGWVALQENDTQYANEKFVKAARLGNKNAQEALNQQGLSW